MANLGSDNTPVKGENFSLPAGAQIDEDDGDLVVRDSGGDIVVRRDEDAGSWDFVSTDLEGIASLEAESVSTKVVDVGPSKIGLFSDSHYHEASPRAEIPSTSEIKSRWDTIIDTFNSKDVDGVVHLGDLVDSINASSSSEYKSWLQIAIDYLESQGGSAGNGFDVGIEYVMGDHEVTYLGGSDWGAYPFDSRSDTYYKTEIGSHDLVVVNDCTSDANFNTDHTVGQEQLDWLKTTLFEDSRPKIVVMHIPPFEPGTGTDGKDVVSNGQEILKIVETCPHVSTSLFGHMHHNDNWDRLRSDRQGWLHIPDSHELMDDTDYTPSGLMIAGIDGGAFVESSYNGTSYPESWGFASSGMRAGQTQQPLTLGERTVKFGERPDGSKLNPKVGQRDILMGIGGKEFDTFSTTFLDSDQRELIVGNSLIELMELGQFVPTDVSGDGTNDRLVLSTDNGNSLALTEAGSGQNEIIVEDGALGVALSSSPPANPEPESCYFDDGTNTGDGNPGIRYTTDGGSNWTDMN